MRLLESQRGHFALQIAIRVIYYTSSAGSCQCPSGPVGATGERGPTGNRGQRGDRGNTGLRGSQGERGPPGNIGSQGGTGGWKHILHYGLNTYQFIILLFILIAVDTKLCC